MEQRLSLVTLGVADLARARAFYEQGLGWHRANAEPDVAFYQLPGIVLALWTRSELAADARVEDTGAAFGGITLAHNTRRREDVDALLATAAATGGRITRAATETEWGGRSGYVQDPDGHVWEIAWNPAWRIDGAGATRVGPQGA